jgi:mRNA interferase YafQ
LIRTIRRTTEFKRDIKRLLRSGKDIEKLLAIVKVIAEGRKLPSECHDHSLGGKYKNMRDCHIEPDWILIYEIEDGEIILYRTGSHPQLFR